MDTILAEQGFNLTYLHDPSTSDAFDPCRILDDLSDGGVAGAVLPWQNVFRMAESDHLVLVAGRSDRRCLGLLAASDLATEREPFLFLDAAWVTPEAGAANLLHRMVAFAILHIGGFAPVPTVLAACVRSPAHACSLRDIGQRFTAASRFPAAADDVVIDLGMAALARRILRVVRPSSRYGISSSVGAIDRVAGASGGAHRMEETLVVLDLSMADDATILDDARRLYRARPKRDVQRGMVDVVAGHPLSPQRRVPDATAV